MTNTTIPTPPEGPHAELVLDLNEQTRVVRAVDAEFKEGSSRHWVKALNEAGYSIATTAALSDSVPREQYVRTVDERAAWEHLAHKAERERDEALAVNEQAPHADTFCTAGEPYGQAECVCWKSKAPADALARVKAEAGARALDDAAKAYPDTAGELWIAARAAALRGSTHA